MDLGSPLSLFSGLLIGLVGMALFIYGKKQADWPSLGVGVVLCIFPYFIAAVWLMWLIAGACIGGLFLLRRAG